MPTGLTERCCYWGNVSNPACGPVEFWWKLPDKGVLGASWLGLCARCCAIMRKNQVSAERITNTCPVNAGVCYAGAIIIHYEKDR